MKTNLCWALVAFLLAAGTQTASAVRDPFLNKKNQKQQQAIKALPDPGNLVAYQNQLGKSFFFEVTGTRAGTIWGTGVYTNDSLLSAAAVHAGILKHLQKGIIKVTILPGQGVYQGSVSNGISSHNYGMWNGSYSIEAVGKK
jgi:hypothetical protein